MTELEKVPVTVLTGFLGAGKTTLRDRGVDIFRSKGVLAVRGWAERYVFQGVHMLMDGRDRPWGDDPRVNKLVFIGRNLDSADLEEGLRVCRAG